MHPAAYAALYSYEAKRRRFVSQLTSLTSAPVVIWLPKGTDITAAVDEGAGNRIWTAEATMQGRLSKLGNGHALTFNGTSNYLNSPDTANLSFGNDTTDSVFSMFVVANVTDTAGTRIMVAKHDTSQVEYHFRITTTDLLQTVFADSLAATDLPLRTSDGAITQGSWTTFGFSYDGGGGATAANGVVLYQLGAAVASTATNDAQYVAMNNGTGLPSIGAITTAGTPGSFFSGSLAMAMVIPANLSAAQHAQLNQWARGYFGI